MSFNNLINLIGLICSRLSFLLVILVSTDVFLRYIFNFSSASIYELEWQIFALIFLLGSVYTLYKDEHVRVDVFYNRLSKKNQESFHIIDTENEILYNNKNAIDEIKKLSKKLD